MADIYNILSKHFLHETSEEEEKQIEKFRKENKTEYKLLKELWKRGDIKVKDFDTKKAFEIVKQKTKNKKGKIISLNKTIFKIAVAVLFSALVIKGVYSTYSTFKNQNIVVMANTEKTKEIILSDGSKIFLNKNAKLEYSKNFNRNIRKVMLDGEAFFEVAKNHKKPFVVTTSNSNITVLGTSFNIKSNTNKTKVTVATGKVSVSNKNKKHVIITPGFSAEVFQSNVEKFKTENANFLSWKTGDFIFKEADLKQVINDLNTYYNDKFVIEEDIKACKLTAKFDNIKINDVIEILELSCNLKIEKKNNKYVVKLAN